MSENDDRRVDALLKGAAKLDVKPEGEHLDDEVLLAYRRHTLAPEKEDAADVHLASCPSCRQLVAALDATLPDLSARRAKNVLLAKRRPYGLIAAAAAILFALGASITMMRAREPSTRYAIEGPFGGIEDVRGDVTASKKFDASSTVRLIVRPEQATADRPAITLAVAPVGQTEQPTAAFEVKWNDRGTAEVVAPARALFSEPGRYVVSCVVGSGASALRLRIETEYVGVSP